MRRELTKMSHHDIAILPEAEYQEFLRLKRRTLMRGKKSSVHLTCNRLNRRRWTRNILRRYNILRKTIKEEQESETTQ